MQFSVIIGNPPYQLPDGGYNRSSIPIYQRFVMHSKRLRPRYIVMVIPSRWYIEGKGLESFRKEMITDRRIKEIHDFPTSLEVFPDLKIRGGICYFLWDRDYLGDCKVTNYIKDTISVMQRPLLDPSIGLNVFIRYNEALSILEKVRDLNEPSFSALVSGRNMFGLRSYYLGKDAPFEGAIKLYRKGGIGYVSRQKISRGLDLIATWKVFIPVISSNNDKFPNIILRRPILGEPNSVCSETYLCVGAFDTEDIAKNVISYIKTKFFRFLVLLNKSTQNAPRRCYYFVPIQDFSKSWTDIELYNKYNLTVNEINFIDNLISNFRYN